MSKKFNTFIKVNGVPTETTMWMNYEFVRDLCGSMRGYASMFSQEERDSDYPIDREIRLHWLPVAASKVVTDYHLAPMGVNSSTARKGVKEYIVSLFTNLAEANSSILDSSKWRSKEVVNAVFEELFFGHTATISKFGSSPDLWNTMVGMSTRLQLTIDAILNSDKYCFTNHAYKLQDDAIVTPRVSTLMLKLACDSSTCLSDFEPIIEGFKESGAHLDSTPGTDYYKMVDWITRFSCE